MASGSEAERLGGSSQVCGATRQPVDLPEEAGVASYGASQDGPSHFRQAALLARLPPHEIHTATASVSPTQGYRLPRQLDRLGELGLGELAVARGARRGRGVEQCADAPQQRQGAEARVCRVGRKAHLEALLQVSAVSTLVC